MPIYSSISDKSRESSDLDSVGTSPAPREEAPRHPSAKAASPATKETAASPFIAKREAHFSLSLPYSNLHALVIGFTCVLMLE